MFGTRPSVKCSRVLSFLTTPNDALEASILFGAAEASFRPRIIRHGRNIPWMNRIGSADDVPDHVDGALAIQA